MCSDAEIRQLISRITLNEKCSPSLDLLNNVDLIYRLIADRRKINFEYGKYDTDKKIKYYHKKRELIPVHENKTIVSNSPFVLCRLSLLSNGQNIYAIPNEMPLKVGDRVNVLLCNDKKEEAIVIAVEQHISTSVPPDYGNNRIIGKL